MPFRSAFWAAPEGANPSPGDWLRRTWSAALLLGAVALGDAAQGEERRFRLENGDFYQGEIGERGMRTGRGLYIWANGNRYEGEFVENLMHGQGMFSWSNGNRYQGQFQRGQPSGEGRFDWGTGESYQGRFADGEMHGFGAFSWPDGRVYEGHFVAGRKAGRGEYRLPNGSRYDGEFRNDRREGLGTFHWRDGTIYRGQFREDKMHGFGVKQEPEGGMVLQHWKQGNLAWSRPLVEEPRCRLRIFGKSWMFRNDACINGLAHGRGLAASLDGELIVAEGRFVLGHLVEGEPQRLRLADS